MTETTLAEAISQSKNPEALVKAEIEASREATKTREALIYKAADAANAIGRQDLHDQLLSSIPTDRLSEWRSRRNYKRTGIGLSFCASMHIHRNSYHSLQLDGIPARYITSKIGGREFAKEVGMQVAHRHYENVKIDAVTPKPGTVVKPNNDSGSRGVYLCMEDGTFFSVRDKNIMVNFDDVKREIKEGMESGFILSKKFHLEEMIVGPDAEPARDLKFYTFYGKVGLVIEIVRKPDTLHCFYVDGAPTYVGKYDDELFEGAGLPEGIVEQVEQFSLEIPSPFMRIDMYQSAKGSVFGEFTHAPGNFEGFTLEHDRRLGQLYVQSQSRLYADMFSGKKFQKFRDGWDKVNA